MSKNLKYLVLIQKNGTALPSLSATLIDRLPDEKDPLYAEERRIAQDTAAVAYVGMLPAIQLIIYPKTDDGVERRRGHREYCNRCKRRMNAQKFAFTSQTVSAVQTFFLAMALYPDVQRKAQAELDAVVGGSRLPDFSDRDSLPYINALVKESMRWNQVTPLGKPFRSHIFPCALKTQDE